MEQLVVFSIALNELAVAPRNARRHSRAQIRKLTDGIREFGFLVPVLVDATNRIICGHGRVEAARRAGLTHIPAIRVANLSPAQIEAFALFENRISDDASFTLETVGLILTDILELEPDYRLDGTGFEPPELDQAFLEVDGRNVTPDPAFDPLDRSARPTVRLGDLYIIGEHRLFVGDAREARSYITLLAGLLAQMVVSDSPYNVAIAGNVSGSGRVKHGEFVMASGEMSDQEFTEFLTSVFRLLAANSADGAIHFQFMDWRHMREMLVAGTAAYSDLLNLCIWEKTNAAMGSLYRSQHELIFVFKSGSAPHINNVALGRFGRHRSNVFRYPGANSFGKTRDDLKDHPTPKNIDLIADMILDCSSRGEIILDPFSGSGTTILAAHRTGRRGFAIELDPHYAEGSLLRIEKALGIEPIHEQSGMTLAELKAHRSANPGWAA